MLRYKAIIRPPLKGLAGCKMKIKLGFLSSSSVFIVKIVVVGFKFFISGNLVEQLLISRVKACLYVSQFVDPKRKLMLADKNS